MRCLLVSCVYPPEPVVSARTSRDVAEALARRGHEVSVIAPFPNRPAGRLFPGYRRRLRERRTEDGGLDVLRCFSFFSRRPSFASRLLESASFAVTAGWQALTAERPSLIYANTWPIVGTGILLGVARLRGLRLVVNVQDLYPESLASQERIGAGGLSASWLRALDGFIARGCDAVLLVSDRFVPAYRDGRRVPAGALHVVPNWTGGPDALPAEDAVARFRASLGIPRDAFVAGFGGNIATAAGVEGLIEAFGKLAASEAHLLIAGEGSNLPACRVLAARLAPGQVHFHSPWPAGETAVALRAADLLVVPTLSAQSEVSVPSKLMTYLLAGRPVLAVAVPGSALASAVESSGAGWVIEPGAPEGLAGRIREIAALELGERVRRGEAGRAFARRELSPEVGAARIVAVLEQVASREETRA